MTTVVVAPSVPAPRAEICMERESELALRAIYDAQFGRLVGWTTRLVGDRDIAHDLATEAFLKLMREFSSVDEPKAWLYTVTSNLVKDHWRKRSRESAAYSRHEAGTDEATYQPDSATTLTVRAAIESLPERLRTTVLLHYYADMPVALVARQLGKSEGAVKRDLFDARKRMQTLLDGVR